MRIPPLLHEMFGEHQTVAAVGTVLGVGTAATVALLALDPGAFTAVTWWRGLLAAVLVWDIACGCLANVTAPTNDYYAQRPAHRRVFLAVHVHLVLVAILLGAPLLPAVLVWAATIGAAVLVNRMSGSPHQLLAAVAALAGAVVVTPALMGGDPLLTSVALLFTAKVTVAFAVDHTGAARRAEEVAPA